MEHWIAIDSNSAIGMYLLVKRGTIGGASDIVQCGTITHPLIVGKDLDWSTQGFLRLTHLQNPASTEKQEWPLVIPSSAVLFVSKVDPAAGANAQKQQTPTSALH